MIASKGYKTLQKRSSMRDLKNANVSASVAKGLRTVNDELMCGSHRTFYASLLYQETRANKSSPFSVLMDSRKAMTGCGVERHTGRFWKLVDVSASLP